MLAISSFQISIGLMNEVGRKIIGHRQTVCIQRDATAAEVVQVTVVKVTFHDKSFDSRAEYHLCYPDGNPATRLPENDGPFTLRQYRD